jgi:hypothetical protein
LLGEVAAVLVLGGALGRVRDCCSSAACGYQPESQWHKEALGNHVILVPLMSAVTIPIHGPLPVQSPALAPRRHRRCRLWWGLRRTGLHGIPAAC